MSLGKRGGVKGNREGSELLVEEGGAGEVKPGGAENSVGAGGLEVVPNGVVRGLGEMGEEAIHGGCGGGGVPDESELNQVGFKVDEELGVAKEPLVGGLIIGVDLGLLDRMSKVVNGFVDGGMMDFTMGDGHGMVGGGAEEADDWVL